MMYELACVLVIVAEIGKTEWDSLFGTRTHTGFGCAPVDCRVNPEQLYD